MKIVTSLHIFAVLSEFAITVKESKELKTRKVVSLNILSMLICVVIEHG